MNIRELESLAKTTGELVRELLEPITVRLDALERRESYVSELAELRRRVDELETAVLEVMTGEDG